jgi:hypothetical protein
MLPNGRYVQRNCCLIVACICVLLTFGCSSGPMFRPPSPQAGAASAFDTSGDGVNDFYMFANEQGRITHIGYQRSPGDVEKINLDAVATSHARHVVIILDGYGFDTINDYYQAGGLRMFHPPSLVIAPYPAMTDLAMVDILGCIPCDGFEARYFSNRRNRIVGGSCAYLAGDNQPYNDCLDYRAPLLWDALGYVWPKHFFKRELKDALKSFEKSNRKEFLAYFVTSAGISTKEGRAGQIESLAQLEQFIHRLIYESRGLVKITLTADHGHGCTTCKRIPLEAFLKAKGWRDHTRLDGPRDVVYIRFGLETYVGLHTLSPHELAADLMELPGVDLASYADGDQVVVLASPRDGGGVSRATIARKDGRYSYTPQAGDPLKLLGVLADMQADADGFYDAEELLSATARHEYPAALERLWRAHFALARNVPDVIVSLHDQWYSGSTSFAGAVTMASTHGSLNYRNSATFIMSTIAPLAPVMRGRDIPENLGAITGRSFPPKR